MLERIKAQMRPLSMQVEGILGELFQDHERLFAALRDRDGDRAEQAFRAHNERMMRLISGGLAAGKRLDAG